jgi:hypothetical protein
MRPAIRISRVNGMHILTLLRRYVAATLLMETPWRIAWVRIDFVPTAPTFLATFLIKTSEATINPSFE